MGYILTDTSPAYELVGDITVSSATTSVSFTGLNFTSADDLLLVSNIKGSSASIYINGNTTSTNYYYQRLNPYGSSLYVERSNSAIFSPGYANYFNTSYTKIKLCNSGYFAYQSNCGYQSISSDWQIDMRYGSSTFTVSSITSITIAGSVQLDVGSRFRLYKLVAEKVADITVSTATTSVDITGLSIDKGSEYMLVSDVLGNSSSTSLKIYSNNNTTDTNYWSQQIYASSTSVSAERANIPIFRYINSDNAISCVNIKLTNNGNFVYQSSNTKFYGTSSVALQAYNGTSTFTATSITQLTLTATASNAIGVGSRFQLYKLR